MPDSTARVARGLLLHGRRLHEGDRRARRRFFQEIGVTSSAFSEAAADIGGKVRNPGLRFFDQSDQRIAFGPGAGLVLGVSVGSESLRAALVDANGRLHHETQCDPWPGQLQASPNELLDRVRDASTEVLSPAFEDDRLLVDGRLPFLGIAVAWPTAVDREDHPAGHALASTWRRGRTLPQRIARHLRIEDDRSHALNDAHAAAIAVAFDYSRRPDHVKQQHPHLICVLRVGGGIGAATIILEDPDRGDEFGPTSGFPKSVLIGGFDQHAGELGHVGVSETLVSALNADRRSGLRALAPFRCSCVEPSDIVPDHLEAYAAAPSLANRIAPGEPMSVVLSQVLESPDEPLHRRALDDVGTLVGEALLGPIAMLNPWAIVLTGALAPDIVEVVDSHIAEAGHPIHTHPTVRCLSREENAYIRVQGAALAVLRRHVHRELSSLVGGPASSLQASVRQLTTPMAKIPWQ